MSPGNQFKAHEERPPSPEGAQSAGRSKPRSDKLRAGRAIVLGVPLALLLWGVLYLIWTILH